MAVLGFRLAWITIFDYYYFFPSTGCIDGLHWGWQCRFWEKNVWKTWNPEWYKCRELDTPVTHCHLSLTTVCSCTVLRRKVRHLQAASVKCSLAPSSKEDKCTISRLPIWNADLRRPHKTTSAPYPGFQYEMQTCTVLRRSQVHHLQAASMKCRHAPSSEESEIAY